MKFSLRLASASDIPAITALIDASVRGLQARDYTPEQIDLALKHVYGADSQLIADGTYFVVETTEGDLAGCGGWSRRRTLYGGDAYAHREDGLLDPQTDAARIRAFFVHPDWGRRGVGSMILRACERAAMAEGFTRLEMGSTLTGVALYTAHGYAAAEQIAVPLPGGETLRVVRMGKSIEPQTERASERLATEKPDA